MRRNYYRYNPLIPEVTDDWKYGAPEGEIGWEIPGIVGLNIEFLGRHQYEKSGLASCVDILRVGQGPDSLASQADSPDLTFKVRWNGLIDHRSGKITYTLAGVYLWDEGWQQVFSYAEIEQIDDPEAVVQLAYAICMDND
jgi:hypothetical protein